MPSAKVIAKKQEAVNDVSQKLQQSVCSIVADYRGLSVAQMTDLRKQLRESNVELQVIKNTLVRRAVADTTLQPLEEYLAGPSAIAFSNDIVAPAKILSTYAKRNDKLKLKGGVVEGRIINESQIKALADLPSREGLLSMLLSVLQAPMRNFALAVKAVSEQKAENSAD